MASPNSQKTDSANHFAHFPPPTASIHSASPYQGQYGSSAYYSPSPNVTALPAYKSIHGPAIGGIASQRNSNALQTLRHLTPRLIMDSALDPKKLKSFNQDLIAMNYFLIQSFCGGTDLRTHKSPSGYSGEIESTYTGVNSHGLSIRPEQPQYLKGYGAIFTYHMKSSYFDPSEAKEGKDAKGNPQVTSRDTSSWERSKQRLFSKASSTRRQKSPFKIPLTSLKESILDALANIDQIEHLPDDESVVVLLYGDKMARRIELSEPREPKDEWLPGTPVLSARVTKTDVIQARKEKGFNGTSSPKSLDQVVQLNAFLSETAL